MKKFIVWGNRNRGAVELSQMGKGTCQQAWQPELGGRRELTLLNIFWLTHSHTHACTYVHHDMGIHTYNKYTNVILFLLLLIVCVLCVGEVVCTWECRCQRKPGVFVFLELYLGRIQGAKFRSSGTSITHSEPLRHLSSPKCSFKKEGRNNIHMT